jgi:hypothetical protein
VQALVEEEMEVEGELEVLHEDRDVGSRYVYFLKTARGRFALHFVADPPTSKRALGSARPACGSRRRSHSTLVARVSRPSPLPYRTPSERRRPSSSW